MIQLKSKFATQIVQIQGPIIVNAVGGLGEDFLTIGLSRLAEVTCE